MESTKFSLIFNRLTFMAFYEKMEDAFLDAAPKGSYFQ